MNLILAQCPSGNGNGCGKTHRLDFRLLLRHRGPLAAGWTRFPLGRRCFTIWSLATTHVFLRERRKNRDHSMVSTQRHFLSLCTISLSMEAKSLSQRSHVCSRSSVTEHILTWTGASSSSTHWKCGYFLEGDAAFAPMLVSETSCSGLRSEDNFPGESPGDIATFLSLQQKVPANTKAKNSYINTAGYNVFFYSFI